MLFHRLLTLKSDNLAFFQIMVLLLTTIVGRVCTGMKYGPMHNYRRCKDVCARSLSLCLKGCIESRTKVCLKKFKKCEAKCKKAYTAHVKR